MKTPWLSYMKPNPQARMRLFCLPYAGGSATIYRMWSSLMPAWVEICAIELPGRGVRISEPAFTNDQELIEELGSVLVPLLDKPYALFGHSMGALLSFELARWLRDHQQADPKVLFVSAHRAPQLKTTDTSTYDLPDDQLITKIKHLNGVPAEVLDHTELMQLMLPIIRADFTICDCYQYQPARPLNCPIFAFGGLQDPMVTREQLDQWKTQTTQPFHLQMLYGDHFFLHSGQYLLTQLIIKRLLENES